MIHLNLVRSVSLAQAAADAVHVAGIRTVRLVSTRGIRPAYDAPLFVMDGRGRPMTLTALDRPCLVLGYRARRPIEQAN